MLSPQCRGFLLDGQRQSSKLSLIADRHEKSQVVRSPDRGCTPAARTPRNWRSSFAFFVPFRRHFNDKQLANLKVIFGSSAEVCILQKSGKRRWEAMISPRPPLKTEVEIFRGCARPSCPSRVTPLPIKPLCAFAKQITVLFCHFSKLYFVFDFVPVFRFLTLSFSYTVRLFKSSLKKDRAILPETSGQRSQVNSCAGAEGELKD